MPSRKRQRGASGPSSAQIIWVNSVLADSVSTSVSTVSTPRADRLAYNQYVLSAFVHHIRSTTTIDITALLRTTLPLLIQPNGAPQSYCVIDAHDAVLLGVDDADAARVLAYVSRIVAAHGVHGLAAALRSHFTVLANELAAHPASALRAAPT